MVSPHITDFIIRHVDKYTTDEIFVAQLDNGGIRVGYKSGRIIDFPKTIANNFITSIITAKDFYEADNILINSEIF